MRRFDSGAAQPRALAFEMWSTCRAAADELQQWSGIDDEYQRFEEIYGQYDCPALDALVVEMARELAGEASPAPSAGDGTAQ